MKILKLRKQSIRFMLQLSAAVVMYSTCARCVNYAEERQRCNEPTYSKLIGRSYYVFNLTHLSTSRIKHHREISLCNKSSSSSSSSSSPPPSSSSPPSPPSSSPSSSPSPPPPPPPSSSSSSSPSPPPPSPSSSSSCLALNYKYYNILTNASNLLKSVKALYYVPTNTPKDDFPFGVPRQNTLVTSRLCQNSRSNSTRIQKLLCAAP